MQKRDKYDNLDIVGRRFGKLVAIEKTGRSKWLLHCDCGNDIELNYSRLLCGQKSCGCLRNECAKQFVERGTKHGKCKSKLYHKYQSMLSRCRDTNNKRYGGRGIDVCNEWKNSFESFYTWAYANGYDETKDGRYWSLDRIDNNLGYSPENCRFTTAREQMRNRNITTTYEYHEQMYSASEFADKFGIHKSYVYYHVKRGQSLDTVLTNWIKSHNIPSNYVDVESYAKSKGVTRTTVNRWIHSGKVLAEKRGKKWYIKN